MQKVIKGKLYSTDTAKALLGSMLPDGHFSETTLYRTQKGAFFVHKIKLDGGRRMITDEDIQALTEEEAQEYVGQSKVGLDKWKDIFGQELEEA